MTLYKDKYRIESLRLPDWDYASAGYYFVTICTYERGCFLGEISEGAMVLSPQGTLVAEEWQRTESLRENVVMDEWVIMPNHLHGIIVLNDPPVETPRRGVSDQSDVTDPAFTQYRDVAGGACRIDTKHQETPQRGVSTGMKPNSLGSIINQFKAACTKRIRAAGHDFAWQTRYYEHIIRDETSFNIIRQYIRQNPMRWDTDKNNPKNL